MADVAPSTNMRKSFKRCHPKYGAKSLTLSLGLDALLAQPNSDSPHERPYPTSPRPSPDKGAPPLRARCRPLGPASDGSPALCWENPIPMLHLGEERKECPATSVPRRA